jgi:hypothetical protein
MGKSVEDVEIARFYTRSRRFPKMIGRMHDGTKIPGGPYTVTQAAVGGLLFLLAVTTRAKWGTGSILVDIPISLGVAWGAAWLAGRIPSTRRNLLSVVLGGAGAMFKPADGKYRGTPLRLRAPHAATGRVHMGAGVLDLVVIALATEPDLVTAPVTAPTPTPAAARPASATTAVERLLEQARTK